MPFLVIKIRLQTDCRGLVLMSSRVKRVTVYV